ncbi:hypothetical protein [Pseudomonas syringae]|uniref:hypothetical protein n=1 Tax=Pseudomonas syringae TaxID=317 RepID=UPI000464E733|nr:hypothetical protein [Pseudomonas syringae]
MNNSNEIANFQRYIIDQLKAGRITKEQAVQALAKTDANGGSMREEQSGPPGSTRYVPVWRDAPLGRALDVAQAHEQHCVVVVTEHGHERLVDTLKARLDQRLLARMTRRGGRQRHACRPDERFGQCDDPRRFPQFEGAGHGHFAAW